MPIYEYQCNSCEHKLEAIQKISEGPLTQCPECGEDGLRKLISAASFRLKGSGWYETDFKNKPDQSKVKSEGESKKSGEKSKSSAKSKDTATGSSDKKAAGGP